MIIAPNGSIRFRSVNSNMDQTVGGIFIAKSIINNFDVNPGDSQIRNVDLGKSWASQ
jgi:hypothetical protein